MPDLLDLVDALTGRLMQIAVENGACPVCGRDLTDHDQGGHAEGCEFAEVMMGAAEARRRVRRIVS